MQVAPVNVRHGLAAGNLASSHNKIQDTASAADAVRGRAGLAMARGWLRSARLCGARHMAAYGCHGRLGFSADAAGPGLRLLTNAVCSLCLSCSHRQYLAPHVQSGQELAPIHSPRARTTADGRVKGRTLTWLRRALFGGSVSLQFVVPRALSLGCSSHARSPARYRPAASAALPVPLHTAVPVRARCQRRATPRWRLRSVPR